MKIYSATLFLAVISLLAPQAGAAQAAAPAPNSGDPCPAPAVVASFLGFTDAQAAQFGGLLGQLEPTLHGLQEQIAARQTQLDTLLSQSNPNPAVVGSFVLQIRALTQQVAQAVQSFQSQFATLLTDEQKQKVQAVAQASQLQPVVGAFVSLNLAPAPTPLPCQKP